MLRYTAAEAFVAIARARFHKLKTHTPPPPQHNGLNGLKDHKAGARQEPDGEHVYWFNPWRTWPRSTRVSPVRKPRRQ